MSDAKKSELAPAFVDIVSATCTSGEADALVEIVLTVRRTENESIEGDPTVTVGGTSATVNERGPAVEVSSGIWQHTFDASATVDCDSDYTVNAKVNIVIEVEATPSSVHCDECVEDK